MKKLTSFLLGSALLLSTVACTDDAKTSADAPNTVETTPDIPEAEQVQDAQEDAQSEVRRNQLNSDIRAREQRNNAFNSGAAQDRDSDDIASEVRSKLEANLPASELVIKAEEGMIIVSGTVPTEEQLDRIEPLAKEIKGVQSVNNQAIVAPAQPEEDNDNIQN
ncbi:BON domain-containing protein [Lyngbya sp. PCC 8106]|uniref:BON domain-containing protein n=1 Tax=Lyngbya sp. (strain PCC 8106) TaxID=313612 RepID=UPI0000EAA90D|nr:BON domain-containing protein [Lyngbya sp. PCC 8106]EAW37461.1 Transport-associated protein [Lyngbya sp. PCC 8106]